MTEGSELAEHRQNPLRLEMDVFASKDVDGVGEREDL